ncbi:hypothetical protein PVK06_001532 [Gossypium arboreum]|uniref:Uncharacterized protein n=1 Tax=Gossypium arboreum TaxID=29729 RepID=A0ABR0R2B3_GOSAR|nr:hypothetical protein PVK06_001532 [Gossypium arboreum]
MISISLWALWYRRNKWVHEGIKFSLQETLRFINGYFKEISLCNESLKSIPRSMTKKLWRPLENGFIKVNFNASFQSVSNTSISTTLARDYKGEIVGAST